MTIQHARFAGIALIAVLVCLIPVGAEAQTSLTGRVADDGNSPVPGAAVELLTPAGEPSGLGAGTDLDGRFTISLRNMHTTPSGSDSGEAVRSYRVRVTHIGYRAEVVSIQMDAGVDNDIGTVTLVPRYADLHEVTLTAARFGENGHTEPWPETRSSLRAVAIETATPRAAAEILRDNPAISVQKTSHGGGSAVIRGLDANRIVPAVDGIRLNNSAYRLGNHPYLNLIDPFMLDHVNLLQGPGSVRFGSDALGGAVHLVTLDPDLPETGQRFSLRTVGRFGSADHERTAHVGVDWSNATLGMLGGASFTRLGDLRRGTQDGEERLDVYTPYAVQSPTGFDQRSFNLKLRYKPAPRTNLIAAWQHARREHIPRYDKYEIDGDLLWEYHPQQRDLTYVRWEQNWSRKRVLLTETRLWYQRQEEGRITQESVSDPRTEELDVVHTLGVSLQGSAALQRHYLVAGVDVYHDEIASERRFISPANVVTSDTRGRYPDGSTYFTTGLFLRHHWAATERLRFSAGVRGEQNHASFNLPANNRLGGSYEQKFASFAAQFGVLWFFLNGTSSLSNPAESSHGAYVRMNASRGYRAPNLSDLARLGESRGDNYEVPNPDLSAETATSIEAGTGWNGDRYHYEVTLHHTRLEDLIGRGPTTWDGSDSLTVGGTAYEVWSRLNEGRGWIRGIEAEGALSLGFRSSWEIHGAAAILWSRNEETGDPLDNVPPLMGRIGLLRSFGNTGAVELYSRFAFEKDNLSPDEIDDPRVPPGGTPAWWTVNLRGRYNFSLGPHVPASLRASLEN
ncbi:TonB-dependent receptor, partial [bacterium]|nr:TonB-dependent receptor [bacterium]